jgi:diguanylate cyclase (GGDEF)-like protein/PAS domain S-box-containing protein
MEFLKAFLSNLNIRTKLIILFIFIKVIPLILLAVITLFGIHALDVSFTENSVQLKETTKEVVSSTAEIAVADSISALDRKSQDSLEKMSNQLAHAVADFLYERDHDLLFLATVSRDKKIYENFVHSKTRSVIKEQSDLYSYDNALSIWRRSEQFADEALYKKAALPDNAREFNRIDPVEPEREGLPLYKEVTFFDLQGVEQIKVSSLDVKKKNISLPENTYIKAETYFDAVKNLKEGDIYVSEVIGAYVPSRIIGMFSKEKAEKAGIPFTPEEHGYAGKENPVGKRFEGIIRFVTPVYEKGKKIGYISVALDHRHVMAFTDTFDPLRDSPADISDASAGNYAFMWDSAGRSISHARDYFITGFDPATGQRVTPWLSSEIEQAFNASNTTDINEFLQGYPTFDTQSLSKKPSLTSIKKGLVGLDCRYLNFAPQCQGWMQLTENGGLGSFIIFWSNVWKLSTAATIPYYTGQYGKTARGFGFITLGANVKEFHKAAYQTKENLNSVLVGQLSHIDQIVGKSEKLIKSEIDFLINELTLSTFIMIVIMMAIAIWLSNLLRRRIQTLIFGAEHYSRNDLSYRIPVDSKDEIGMLSNSFNDMANSLQDYVQKEKNLNLSLELRIAKRTEQLVILNDKIQKELVVKELQEKQLEIYASVFSNTTEAILITDSKGIINHVNNAFTVLTDYRSDEVIGDTYHVLKSYKHSSIFYQQLRKTVFSKEIWEGEIWSCKKDGTLYPALTIIIPILGKNGEITNFVAIQRDVSDMKENEKVLHRQAYYDPLTKLANRALGYEKLEEAILEAKLNNTKVAVLFLDLDKFKQVNDTMGHDVGDMLLCKVGKRLKEVCKNTDTISRLGGDEFLIILEGILCYESAIDTVKNILEMLVEPFVINEQLIHTSTSIGISFYPDDSLTVSGLLKNSDIAMYRAKAKGRGVYEIFTEALSLQVQETVVLEQALKEAVINKDFLMHYQPVINIKDREVVGLEALMRWKREDKLYYPDTFIPGLENTKLIIGATEGMMVDIFNFTHMLNRRYNKELYVTINISAIHFALPDFCDRLIELVTLSELKVSLVCLEVTETIFLNDIEVVANKLNELKQFGFKIALDDFGTGYSSLTYLKRLPMDTIKIDRSFIKELPHSAGDVAITTSVCSWGENFKLNVIAEGVETTEQLEFLEKAGCDSVQGYLFSKPLDESALLEYLDEKL